MSETDWESTAGTSGSEARAVTGKRSRGKARGRTAGNARAVTGKKSRGKDARETRESERKEEDSGKAV